LSSAAEILLVSVVRSVVCPEPLPLPLPPPPGFYESYEAKAAATFASIRAPIQLYSIYNDIL